jgi:hypothetical protein
MASVTLKVMIVIGPSTVVFDLKIKILTIKLFFNILAADDYRYFTFIDCIGRR